MPVAARRAQRHHRRGRVLERLLLLCTSGGSCTARWCTSREAMGTALLQQAGTLNRLRGPTGPYCPAHKLAIKGKHPADDGMPCGPHLGGVGLQDDDGFGLAGRHALQVAQEVRGAVPRQHVQVPVPRQGACTCTPLPAYAPSQHRLRTRKAQPCGEAARHGACARADRQAASALSEAQITKARQQYCAGLAAGGTGGGT